MIPIFTAVSESQQRGKTHPVHANCFESSQQRDGTNSQVEFMNYEPLVGDTYCKRLGLC